MVLDLTLIRSKISDYSGLTVGSTDRGGEYYAWRSVGSWKVNEPRRSYLARAWDRLAEERRCVTKHNTLRNVKYNKIDATQLTIREKHHSWINLEKATTEAEQCERKCPIFDILM